ncbi:MAG: CHASE2 domain-containing protein, partial [Nitrospirota bacterium]
MGLRKRVINSISLGVVLSIILIFISIDIFNPSFLEVLELKTLDDRFRIKGRRETGREVAIVIIDEESIREFGRWPWTRDKLARLVDLLALGGAKVIGFDIIFSEPDQSDSLKTISRLKDEYRRSGRFDQRTLEILQ